MQFKDEEERLIAEQAVLAYREVQTACRGAAFGHGLEVLEEAVIVAGRRQQRQMLEKALGSQAEAQKKGAVVRVAGVGGKAEGRVARH